MTKIDTKTSKRFTFLLFFTFFLIGLFTFRDYGISIDEEFHRSSGFYWLNYILSFTTFEDLKNLVDVKINDIKGFTLQLPQEHPYYGVVFDLPLAFLEIIFKIENPQNIFYFKHFLNFLLFFVSSIFFYKILLNRFSNYYISLFGTLFFILSPRIYGSSFFNNKDIVFLSFVTIALYYCFKSFDKASYKNFILFAIFAALSTSQRILGIFLPVAFIVFFLLSFLSNKRNSEHILKIFFFFAFYFLFLIISWPLLWGDPINNFVLTFKYFSNHPLKLKMLLAASVAGVMFAGSVLAGTLDDVRARGKLNCIINTGLAGFAAPDDKGKWQGFDVDFCKAVAAAVLGDANKVSYTTATGKTRFTKL